MSVPKLKKFLGCLLALILLPFAAMALRADTGSAGKAADVPVTRQGVLDLRTHDFGQRPKVDLVGDWGFYWRQLVPPDQADERGIARNGVFAPVPKHWNDENPEHPPEGFATYALTLLLPKEVVQQRQVLAIKVMDVLTALRLWVDGREVYANGQVGTTPETSLPEYRPGVIFFTPTSERVSVVIQISNFHYRNGGMWAPMTLGLSGAIEKDWYIRSHLDLLMVGGLCLLGLNHLGLYFLRREDRSTLYFGLLCLALFMRNISSGDHLIAQWWPGFNWELARRLEFLPLSAGPLSIIFYLRTVFPTHATTRIRYFFFRLLMIFNFAVMAAICVLPSAITNHMIPAMQLGMLFGLVWIFAVVLAAARSRTKGSGEILFCMLVLGLAVVNDILYVRSVVHTGLYVPFAFLFFLLFQSLTMARNYAQSHLRREVAETAWQQADQALAELRQAQSQLVQSEKMAALGQLVASVAHEINTPIGAIKASGKHIADELTKTLQNLQSLFQLLGPSDRDRFARLIGMSQVKSEILGSREERALSRTTTQQLEKLGIADARRKADMLVQLKAHRSIDEFLPLLRHRNAELILETAHGIATIISNTDNINVAVGRVAKIVFALKSYSRAQAAETASTADLREGLETVLTIYQSQLRQGIELVRDYEDIPPVQCFPDQLNQIWTNLIHNAIQAMRGKGTLTLSIRRVNDEAVVSVGDTGGGIPEEIRGRIFDPFFTTKPVGEGSGLGLDIVKKIIDKHKGRVELKTEVGVGTTFSIHLPYRHD